MQAERFLAIQQKASHQGEFREIDMPISGEGWEIHIHRRKVQVRAMGGRRRTVGMYQVFHDGVPQLGFGLSGTTAEPGGPGANAPENNGLRIEAGRYALATQAGKNYVTIGFRDSTNPFASPKPGILLLGTNKRTSILIHPGRGFLRSTGCINLCARLQDASEGIDYPASRSRVISVINDLQAFIGHQFPDLNGRPVPNAFAVIDGEPSP